MGAKSTKTSAFPYRASAQPRHNQPRLNRDVFLDPNQPGHHNYFVKVVIVGDEPDRTKLLNKISVLSTRVEEVDNVCPVLDFAIAYLALPQPEFLPFRDPNSKAIYKFHLCSYGAYTDASAGTPEGESVTYWPPAIFSSATIVLAVTKPETGQQLFDQLAARNDISAATVLAVTNKVATEVKSVSNVTEAPTGGVSCGVSCGVSWSSSYTFDFDDSEKVQWMIQDAVETT